jgi:nicotinate-nucleotide pyrophosphorylase
MNHRLNLADQYLVKDNHILILKKAGGFDVFARRRKKVPFEIEVECLSELKNALAYCPDYRHAGQFLAFAGPPDCRVA